MRYRGSIRHARIFAVKVENHLPNGLAVNNELTIKCWQRRKEVCAIE